MQTSRSPLLLTNLPNDLETLCRLLVDRIGSGDILNSYLLAAGAQQIVDDYLHRDPLALRRAASIVERNRPSTWGRINAHTLRLAGGMIWRAAVARPRDRRVSLWRLDVSALVDELAMRVDGPWTGASVEPSLREAAAALAGRLAALPPGLRHELLRLPACFRSFDQAPQDMVTLAQRFATLWPDRKLALTVIGVRSSGSYLAPLITSRLRRLGYTDVHGTTIRPGQGWLRGEARTIRERANRSGMALLIDDPPRTWGSVAEAAGQLVDLGFEPESVVLLLPVFPEMAEPPVGLRRHPALLLPWSEWAISRKLEPDAVERELHRLLKERFAVLDVRLACRHPDPIRRGHGGAVFDVTVGERNEEREIAVRARGVGVGYLGEHSVAVGERLAEWLPELYGLRDGVLYEGWEGPERGLREPLTEEQVGAVVRYVAERGRALGLEDDLGARVFFRGIPWFAGKALSGLVGGAHELGRLLCAALVRGILVVDAPALIDGQADLRRFVVTNHQDGLRRRGLHQFRPLLLRSRLRPRPGRGKRL